LLEEVKFDACMTAAYSPRPNTEAADWPNQIDEAVKQARLTQAKRLVDLHAAERSAAFAGRVEEVLVERRNLKNPLEVMGRTRSNRQVFFQGDIDALKGALVHVRIGDCQPFYLSGEMVESPAV
jgi:tRNA-2-methylthio-N6-dimethylallyladenosine synthase